MNKTRLEMIDVMRGLAALAVAIVHIVHNTTPMDFENDALRAVIESTTRYFYLGVNLFFVVSGFVIPWALMRARYTLHQYPRFMGKRLLRLQPPYYASVLMAIALAYAAASAPGFSGAPPDYTGGTLLAHLVLLPPVFDLEWANPVYWSLLVEVEYYLAIGLIVPLWLKWPPAAITISLLAANLLPLLSQNHEHIPAHAPFFVLGAVLCLRNLGRLSDRQTLVVICVSLLAIALQHGLPHLICGLVALAFFVLPASAPRALTALGTISYSLYLVHYFVGIKAVHVLQRFADTDTERALVYVTALVLSAAAAIPFYWLFERTSLAWSGRIKLRPDVRRTESDELASAPAP
jgi:peptidoglycan/LPS O-acetylase OafA/YrhL